LPHKADELFFARKRPWSKRKDRILAYYLEPYLAKVAKLRRPILIVDGFAGPGKFGDGEPGSPLIICAKAKTAVARGADVSVWCIEQVDGLYARLKENLSDFSFALAFHGQFLEHIPRICGAGETHTLFMYVDPFAVEGLDWPALDAVFRHLQQSGASVELLLNFNAPSFVRRGLATLGRRVPDVDCDVEDPEESDARVSDSSSAERLSQIVGGAWWKDLLTETSGFPEQVKRVTERLSTQLQERFSEIGYTAIKAKRAHLVPKYYLMFASRHPHGLELMNDAMARSSGTSTFYLDLFSRHDLEKLILRLSGEWIARGTLILQVIREAFCMFTRAEIRGSIEGLLKTKRLKSLTGRTRINDSVQVMRV